MQWHRNEAEISELRLAAEDAKIVKGNEAGGGRSSRTDTAFDDATKEKVVLQGTDSANGV